jgi:hypothetical protein
MDDIIESFINAGKLILVGIIGGILILGGIVTLFTRYHESWDTSVWSAGPEVLRSGAALSR